MREGEGSSTALGVSLIRTVHQVIDDLPHILDDPISPMLLSEDLIEKIRLEPEKHRTRAARGLRSHIVLRSRYAEDELHEATIRGVTQFISLGAGYDTFPYRQPSWAHGMRIAELDHPATQMEKRAHFVAKGLKDPDNLAFVPLDLENDDLGKGIFDSGTDQRLPIWISCLGVFAYLHRETVRSVFGIVARLPKGSGIVFAFAPDKAPKNGNPEVPASVAERAAKLGEPWLTRFTMEDLKDQLHTCGFTEVNFLELREAESRYYGNRTDLPVPKVVRLCEAMT